MKQIILKNNKKLEFYILGLHCIVDDTKQKFYTAVLKHKGNDVVTIWFSSYKEYSTTVLEIHLGTNERLIKKYGLPLYKHKVSDFYTQDKKYVTSKKCSKMNALDLGLVNLGIILKELRIYCLDVLHEDCTKLKIKGRATGSNPNSRKTRYITLNALDTK